MALPNQLHLTPPKDFVQEEEVLSFRVPPPPRSLASPMVLQFQAMARPNLVVTRRAVDGVSLAQALAGICADLARHLPKLGRIETTEFRFQDGAPGLLLKYTIPAHEKFSVLQLQAGRVDSGVLTLFTLSTEASRLSEEEHQAYLACIAGATVESREGARA